MSEVARFSQRVRESLREGLLAATTELLPPTFRRRTPRMDKTQATLSAENAVRLVLSHLGLPTASVSRAADDLVRLAGTSHRPARVPLRHPK